MYSSTEIFRYSDALSETEVVSCAATFMQLKISNNLSNRRLRIDSFLIAMDFSLKNDNRLIMKRDFNELFN
jgi:hypothetical protein